MANISLTTRCNRRCAYCFADVQHGGGDNMPVEHFNASLDLCLRSGIHEARLLGGEPTLHPRFCELVDQAVARGLRVLCFSGGLIPRRVLDHLERFSPGQVEILLNCPPARGIAVGLYRRQHEVMRRLGPRVSLGFNFDMPGLSASFLLEAIKYYGLMRRLRLGLAHPVYGGRNRHLHPAHYRAVGAEVARLAGRAASAGIALDLDCGWVPCQFPGGFLASHEELARQVGTRCNPILDLLPDGSVIACYALRLYASLPLAATATAAELRRKFSQRQAQDRTCGLYSSCEGCGWRTAGSCSGGCLAAALRRRRSGMFRFAYRPSERV